jgi:hypothetical protein
MFRFEPNEHRYFLGEDELPSVTTVLRPLYDFSMIDPEVLERKRQIGEAVHKAVELSLAGDLDESSIDPVWAGYFAGWKQFVADTGVTDADIGEAEQPMFHPVYRFAGTPDMTIHLNRKWGVLDLKTTATLEPPVALQTAAYRELLNVNTDRSQHKLETRYALQLRENGTYRLEEYKDKGDWSVFLSLLTVANWKRKHQ